MTGRTGIRCRCWNFVSRSSSRRVPVFSIQAIRLPCEDLLSVRMTLAVERQPRSQEAGATARKRECDCRKFEWLCHLMRQIRQGTRIGGRPGLTLERCDRSAVSARSFDGSHDFGHRCDPVVRRVRSKDEHESKKTDWLVRINSERISGGTDFRYQCLCGGSERQRA